MHYLIYPYTLILIFQKRYLRHRNQDLTTGIYCHLKMVDEGAYEFAKPTANPVAALSSQSEWIPLTIPLLSLCLSLLCSIPIFFTIDYTFVLLITLASRFLAQILSPYPGFSQSCLREEFLVLQVLASWTGIILEEVDTSHSKNVEEDDQQQQKERHALEAMT